MNKHTPGPWTHFAESDADGERIGVKATNSADVADCSINNWRPFEERRANSHLMAAAPDLLEALIWMVDNDDTYEGDTPVESLGGASWNEHNAYWIEGLNKARAAIAKARGES